MMSSNYNVYPAYTSSDPVYDAPMWQTDPYPLDISAAPWSDADLDAILNILSTNLESPPTVGTDFFPGGPALEANAMPSDCWAQTSLHDCFGSPESTSSFDTSFTEASPSPVTFSFATSDTALSSSPIVSLGAPHPGAVVCKWSNCGAVIDTHLLVAHFESAHAKDIPSTADSKEPCLWAGCTHSSRYLRRHAGLHFGQDVACDACGDTFTRQDAVTRHKKRGTCKQCAWCKARFEAVEEKVAHSVQCSKRGKTVRSGRPREVVKVGKAHHHAHPYLC